MFGNGAGPFPFYSLGLTLAKLIPERLLIIFAFLPRALLSFFLSHKGLMANFFLTSFHSSCVSWDCTAALMTLISFSKLVMLISFLNLVKAVWNTYSYTVGFKHRLLQHLGMYLIRLNLNDANILKFNFCSFAYFFYAVPAIRCCILALSFN